MKVTENEKRYENPHRNISFDIIRFLAIFFVMYNHRETYSFFSHLPYMSVGYILTLCATALCKCGAPLFFMVSGALILHKKESFSRILKHRVLRIVTVMLVLCMLTKVMYPNAGNPIQIFMTGLNWYLYSYVGYLMMLPFMRLLVKHMSIDDMKLFVILSAILYAAGGILIPFSNYTENFTGFFRIYNASWASDCWNFVFPILGYIFVQFAEREDIGISRKKIFYLLSLSTIVSIAICMQLMNYDINVNSGQNLEMIRQHAILLPSCFLFFALYCIFSKKQVTEKKGKILTEMSASVFGIFLIETHTVYSLKIYEAVAVLIPNAGLYLCSIVSIMAQVVLYGLVIFVLRRIPIVRKVL